MYPVTIYLCHICMSLTKKQETKPGKPAKARGTILRNLNEQIHYSSFKENRSVARLRVSLAVFIFYSAGDICINTHYIQIKNNMHYR